MSRPQYPHDLDLGAPVERETMEVLLQSQGTSELVRGLFQLMRNNAAYIERTGRQTPQGANAVEFRAYHAGGADAVEELLMGLYAVAYPERMRPDALEPGDGDSGN